MKIQFQDTGMPYPLTILKGYLRLSGVADSKIAFIVSELLKKSEKSNKWTESDVLCFVESQLQEESPDIVNSLQTIIAYENLRAIQEDIPPIVVVIEGASATGKSMVALDLIQALSPTRIISTDTVRQILRDIHSKEEYPELHCHTYQAFKYNQVGDTNLNPIIRGYNAQCTLISPHVIDMTKRVVSEGAKAIIEGVHISPGSMIEISEGVIEILVNPSYKIHQAMFASKSRIGKLKSVTSDKQIREEEFVSTHIIQEYLEKQALRHQIPTINLDEYESVQQETYRLILSKMNHLIELYK